MYQKMSRTSKENKTQDFLLRIQTLERDVEACKNIIKVHQEKERDSLLVIDSYKSKVAKLKEKKWTATPLNI